MIDHCVQTKVLTTSYFYDYVVCEMLYVFLSLLKVYLWTSQLLVEANGLIKSDLTHFHLVTGLVRSHNEP